MFVICPEGKIPYNILIDSGNYNPEVIIIEKTDKPSTIETTKISKFSTIIPTTEITETTVIIPTTQITETTAFISTTQITKTTSIITTDNISKSSTIINSESYSENNLITTNQMREQTTNNYNDKMSSIIIEQNNNIEITTNNNYYDTETIEERRIKTSIINNNNEITEKIEGVHDCPEKCSECDSQKKCTKCNKSKNYYPIELTTEANEQQTIECMTKSQQQKEKKSFYFDPESESFKPCLEKCETCYGQGDGNNNNCKTCSAGFIRHPDYDDSKNCVPKPNPLYCINYGQYTVIESEQCPSNFNFLIKEKGKCIQECK